MCVSMRVCVSMKRKRGKINVLLYLLHFIRLMNWKLNHRKYRELEYHYCHWVILWFIMFSVMNVSSLLIIQSLVHSIINFSVKTQTPKDVTLVIDFCQSNKQNRFFLCIHDKYIKWPLQYCSICEALFMYTYIKKRLLSLES